MPSRFLFVHPFVHSALAPVGLALALLATTACGSSPDAPDTDAGVDAGAVSPEAATPIDGAPPAEGGPAATCSAHDLSRCTLGDAACRTTTCVDGACAYADAPAGQALPKARQVAGDCQSLVCDGHGRAVAEPADDVPPPSTCQSVACAKGVVVRSNAVDGTACAAGLCVGGACYASTCVDHVKDGDESALDCGGTCPGCAVGATCGTPHDCTSGVCNVVCAAPACDDHVKNGSETDVDCGGTCVACVAGATCHVPADCASGVCTGGACAPASCGDHVKNGDETGADCGGATCPACATGSGCVLASDCASGVCTGSVCIAATCSDHVKNAGETDTDCGGPHCAGCGDGSTCATPHDCTSGVCAGASCQVPTCSDHVQNGSETGQDCGGPTCLACPLTGGCAESRDCLAPNECYAGRCAYPAFGLEGARGSGTAQGVKMAHADFDHDGRIDIAIVGTAGVSILRNTGDFGFAVQTTTTAADARDLAIGDFDGDGWTDVAVAAWGVFNNGSAGQLAVHLNDGHGALKAPALYPGANVTNIGSGDVDGDGKTDIVLAGKVATVFLNQGGGTFVAQPITIGTSMEAVALVDTNADGMADLFTTSYANDKLELRLATGGGTFGSPTALIGADGQHLEVADLDGVAPLDLVVSAYSGYGAIWLVRSTGGPYVATKVAGVTSVGTVAVADFDGDALADVAVTVNDHYDPLFGDIPLLTVTLSAGGSYATTRTFQTSSYATALSAADLDGDCVADILAASQYGLTTYPGLGAGDFPNPLRMNIALDDFALGDMNGDGRLDVVGGWMSTTDEGYVSVALNQGSTFSNTVMTADGEDLLGVVTGDFDENGSNDMAVVDRLNHRVDVHLNDGHAGFVAFASFPTYDDPIGLGVADMDGDGHLDLVAACNGPVAGTGEINVLHGDGHGSFGTTLHVDVENPAEIVVRDLDADGFPDVAAVCGGAAISFLWNDGHGNLTQPNYTAYGQQQIGIVAGDFDGVGAPDIALLDHGASTVTILSHAAGRYIGNARIYASPDSPDGIAAGDLNGDGRSDLAIVSHSRGTVGVLLNRGSSFAAPVEYVASVAENGEGTMQIQKVAIADLDGDGRTDVLTSGMTATRLLNRSGVAANVCH